MITVLLWHKKWQPEAVLYLQREGYLGPYLKHISSCKNVYFQKQYVINGWSAKIGQRVKRLVSGVCAVQAYFAFNTSLQSSPSHNQRKTWYSKTKAATLQVDGIKKTRKWKNLGRFPQPSGRLNVLANLQRTVCSLVWLPFVQKPSYLCLLDWFEKYNELKVMKHETSKCTQLNIICMIFSCVD